MIAHTVIAESEARPVARPRRNPWLQRVMLFVICLLVVNGLVGEGGLADRIRARRELQKAAAGLAELRGKNAALREKASSLDKDASTIEAVARQELGLIRPGEVLVILKKP